MNYELGLDLLLAKRRFEQAKTSGLLLPTMLYLCLL
jgi:hypothetical protein